MSLLKDISEVIKTLKDEYSGLNINEYANRVKGSSIARSGAEGTLQFPVIIPDSINIDTAVMITKVLESQFASFTRITLSMHPYLDLSKDKDISSYLKRYHQNAGSRFNTLGSLLLEGSYDILSNESDEICGLFITTEGCNGSVLKDNKLQLFSVYDYINENSLNDLYKPKNPRVNFRNKSLNNYYNNEIILESKHKKNKSNNSKKQTFKSFADLDKHMKDNGLYKSNGPKFDPSKIDPQGVKKVMDDNKRYKKQINNKYVGDPKDPYKKYPEPTKKVLNIKEPTDKELDRDLKVDEYEYQMYRDNIKDEQADRSYDLKRREFIHKLNREEELDRREQERMNIMNMGNAKVEMTNNDCKKANEIVPTTLALSLNVKDKGNFGGTVNFVIGIKAVLHLVSSSEAVKNMVYACKNNNKFFNFVRWTTGEISFFKDFILQLDQIKTDAINASSKHNAWWSALKRRKNVAKLKRSMIGSKQLLPNATIVLSIEEVNAVKIEHGFDLMDPKMMKRIMDEYFLLAFVVVDSSQEIAYFMFDGQDEPQAMSFTGMERENSSKNDFKEIYKLINSGRL